MPSPNHLRDVCSPCFFPTQSPRPVPVLLGHTPTVSRTTWTQIDPVSTPCATLAGYMAGPIVQRLLAMGHTVHGTCRAPENTDTTKHLTALPGALERLKLFKADLLAPGSFDEAMAGCTLAIHTASPYIINVKQRDVRSRLIDPALRGTENVLGGWGLGRSGGVMLLSVRQLCWKPWTLAQAGVCMCHTMCVHAPQCWVPVAPHACRCARCPGSRVLSCFKAWTARNLTSMRNGCRALACPHPTL